MPDARNRRDMGGPPPQQPGDQLVVMYTCHECGLTDAEVAMPYRPANQNVVAWLDDVAAACGRDHGRRSPACPSREVDLKVPMPAGADRVGGPGLQ